MTSSDNGSSGSTGITHIAVQGYKSLRARQELEVRPLTIMAGVNSAGKSSAMQPLLLLKQTLDTSYDPGPLRLSGPNVDITELEQVLSHTPKGEPQTKSFTVGVTGEGHTTEWTFDRERGKGLRIAQMRGWFLPEQQEPVALRDAMTNQQVYEAFTADVLRHVQPPLPEAILGGITRERCMLHPYWTVADGSGGELRFRPQGPSLAHSNAIAGVIHLPALRGNPARSYPTVAVEDHFPATFATYTAAVISAWQDRKQKEKREQLRADLRELGLTWKAEARQVDDAHVELMVGRLPSPTRGGAHDLVNIADVGFGVSQTLPVVVALLAARPGQLVYLEQPEIHLHPRAQVAFARLLRRAVSRGVRVVVETHSSLLLRGVQTLVAEGALVPDDVILHWFTRHAKTGDTEVATGELDRAGAFGDWPEDFDDVVLDSESRYLDAASQAE